jgi:hypothetical protein
MAVLIEKLPVTSSNCYETMKNASILNKLGTNVDHCLCNDMLSLKFLVTMATRGNLKIAKNHYFALIFSIKIDFKVLQLLNELRKSQRLFRVGYTVPYDRRGVIFSLTQVQKFLCDEGNYRPPLNPPNRRGHIP